MNKKERTGAIIGTALALLIWGLVYYFGLWAVITRLWVT